MSLKALKNGDGKVAFVPANRVDEYGEAGFDKPATQAEAAKALEKHPRKDQVLKDCGFKPKAAAAAAKSEDDKKSDDEAKDDKKSGGKKNEKKDDK